MKSSLIKLAIGTALTLASSLSFADRGRDRHDDDDHRYRGDYRVEEPRRWNHRHFEPSGRHYRPHWNHQWRHHVHDRWCAHQGPAVRYGPRYFSLPEGQRIARTTSSR